MTDGHLHHHDTHADPPPYLRKLFKQWQKSSITEIKDSQHLLDFSQQSSGFNESRDEYVISHDKQSRHDLFRQFCHTNLMEASEDDAVEHDQAVIEIKSLPGLFIYPSLIPPKVQIALLDKLLHRDLSNPAHLTNLHLHYNVNYPVDGKENSAPISFFDADLTHRFDPIDPAVHKSVSLQQILNKKLRWMTLGGQYDWTLKVYPEEEPPPFPPDIANLLKGVFPDVDAQAAIVNFYSPGDTLSVHRDVSEMCDRGLISLSIGCDALFIIGTDDESQSAVIRLRSGDVVLMSDKSRFAWHAVPKILPNTCPTFLQDWPSLSGERSRWKSWMSTKRINLNVRQMKVEE